MKYFSVSYYSQKNDVPKQKIPFDISFLQNPAIVMRLMITGIFTVLMFIMGDTSVAIFMLISFLIIPGIAGNIYHNSYISSVYKSKTIKRPVRVDFYGDHLVYTLESDFFFKGDSERHLGFDKLENIYEFRDVFIFSFKKEGGVNIPKRAMSPEQIDMVYNLVDNLFKNKYVKVDK